MKKIKFICVSIIVILLCQTIGSVSAEIGKNGKVLFIVESAEQIEEISAGISEDKYIFPEDLYVICLADELTSYTDLSTYSAIALYRDSEIKQSLVKEAYSKNTIVYLYGDLTISEYKSYFSIANYSIDVKVANSSQTLTQSFSESYEETEAFQVISYGTQPLLCKISSDSTFFSVFKAVTQNFQKLLSPRTRSTIIKSEFDFVTYFQSSSVHMDYTLYRNYDETDPNYDYFGITTNVWADTTVRLDELRTKYALPNSADNFLETGPATQKNVGTLSVSIGFGSSGLGGDIGFSIDLSNSQPDIDRTEDFTNDIVEWNMHRRAVLPPSMNNAILGCSATWASRNSTATIDVSYQAKVSIARPNVTQSATSEYTKIQIRFAS